MRSASSRLQMARPARGRGAPTSGDEQQDADRSRGANPRIAPFKAAAPSSDPSLREARRMGWGCLARDPDRPQPRIMPKYCARILH
jgi:hypothetical protein